MKANMRREIVIDENGNGIVTKAFAKQAKIFGTEEYKLWKEFKKEFRNAEMVHKPIKKNPNKKSEVRLSYQQMRDFIDAVETDEGQKDAKKKELDTQIRLSKVTANPYRTVLNWFKNYDKYVEYVKSAEANAASEDDNDEQSVAEESGIETEELANVSGF